MHNRLIAFDFTDIASEKARGGEMKKRYNLRTTVIELEIHTHE